VWRVILNQLDHPDEQYRTCRQRRRDFSYGNNNVNANGSFGPTPTVIAQH
jgi:hypothetical protein